MLVRIALALIAVWIALVLFKALFNGFVHILIIAAIVFLLIKLFDHGKKSAF